MSVFIESWRELRWGEANFSGSLLIDVVVRRA